MKSIQGKVYRALLIAVETLYADWSSRSLRFGMTMNQDIK